MQIIEELVSAAQGAVNRKDKMIHRLPAHAGVLLRVSIAKRKIDSITTDDGMNFKFVVRKAWRRSKAVKNHFITITETTDAAQEETLFADRGYLMATIENAKRSKFRFVLSKDQLELCCRSGRIKFLIVRDRDRDSILVLRN